MVHFRWEPDKGDRRKTFLKLLPTKFIEFHGLSHRLFLPRNQEVSSANASTKHQ